MLLAAAGVIIGLVWGLDAVLLYFFFAVIVMFAPAYSRRDRGLTVKGLLGGRGPLGALGLRAAWCGWWAAVGLLLGVVVLQVIAEAAEAAYLRRPVPSADGEQ